MRSNSWGLGTEPLHNKVFSKPLKYKVHANVPAESWMIYDEFLCKFYRDETGKIICEKGDQERNQQTNQHLLNQNTSPLV